MRSHHEELYVTGKVITFIISKMGEALTNPIRYLFRLIGEEVESNAVTIIDPLSTAKATENDPALGPQSTGVKCATCTQDIYHCPGHLGAIKVYPIPVPLAEKNLTQWLSCICHVCGRIGLSLAERASIVQRKGSIEYKDIQASLQSKGRDYSCPFCFRTFQVFRPVGFYTPSGYDFSMPALFYVDFPGRKSEGMIGRTGYHELPIADNYYTWSVLKNATSEDCALFGWNHASYHPSAFMWDYIPVAPPAARPRPSTSTRYVAGKTRKLHGLICDCQVRVGTALSGRYLPQVQRDLINDPKSFNELVLNIFYLYYSVVMLQTHLPDNIQAVVTKEFKIGTQKTGASFIDMLRWKQGVLRKQMAGARHNVCVRTPLTAFTFGAIGTATCPLAFAMKIGVERMVTPENIELMRALVRNGPEVYPGANAYKKAGKTQVNITKKDSEAIAASLVPGDIVLRHVKTGDIALHQRYPSNREESINAVMLVVDPGKLVRIPLAVCWKMMADFDGDDTELFFVSSYGVGAEALFLTSVLRQVIAPYDGRPCIGIGKDAGTDPVFGIKLLRMQKTFSRREINALFSETLTDVAPPTSPQATSQALVPSAQGPQGPQGEETYTFLDIVSALFPRSYYYDAAANGDDPGGDLLIKGGKVQRGDVTTKGWEIFEGDNAHITKSIANSLDPYSAIKVLEDITRIAYRANGMFGWSNCDDMRVPAEDKAKLQALISERVLDIDMYCHRFHTGELAVPIGQDPLEYFERVIAYNLSSKNAAETFKIVAASMKGTMFDYYGYIQQYKSRIPGALISRGQVLAEGHRLRPKLSHGTRHTIWYPKGYDGADAGGYVRSAYIDKLTPPEFFAETIPAREQLFTKGVGIQKQGYYNRKVGTSLGPIHVGYLGEVRGHSDMILDFSYGHIGADSHCVVGIRVDDHIISDAEFQARHGAVPDEYETLLRIRNEWRDAIVAYGSLTSNEKYSPMNVVFEAPFDMNAIIMAYSPSSLSPSLPSQPASSQAASQAAVPSGGEKVLTQPEVWEILKKMRDAFVMAHVGERAGKFMRDIAYNRVDAFMRLFRFTCPSSRFVRHDVSAASRAATAASRAAPSARESKAESASHVQGEEWTERAFTTMLQAMLRKYATCLVPAGDMVGMKASLNIIAPQAQEALHAIRGTGQIKGSISTLGHTHGTDLFLEITEGLTPKNPITSFMLNGLFRYDLQECLDYVKRISSVKLSDVLYKAWLVSVSPDELANTGACGFGKLREYLAALPPTVKKIYEQSRKTWFYVVLHIDSFRLLTNHVEIAAIGRRLQAQFPDAIDTAMSVYENQRGLFIFLSMRDESIDLMHSHFDAIVERGIVHGHPAFSNGTIVEYSGIPTFETSAGSDKGKMIERKAYRIVLNGCDLAFLYSQHNIDKSTIFTSNIVDSSNFYGIEEARFRAFEEMVAETCQMETLRGILRRHIKVFADYLAYRGTLTFVPRFAVGSNPDVDDFDKMVFETADVFLMKSLESAQWRSIRGIMPCNLFGTPHPFGSTMSAVRVKAADLDPASDTRAIETTGDASTSLGAKRVKKTTDSGSSRPRVTSMPMDEAL